MNSEQLTQQLTSEGLRIASQGESGWTYTYINEDGERVTIWVTDIN